MCYHFILTPTPWNKYHYWIHFTGEKTKVLSSYVTCQGHLGHWNFTCTFKPRAEVTAQVWKPISWQNSILFGQINLVLSWFSHLIVSDSLWPHGLLHAQLPCPSLSPGACSNSCPSSWWCHPTISSSVIPFSFCLQLFPASGSLPMS